MPGMRLQSRKNKDEAEKPFWISFTDLMTAMMVLFLLTMTISLLIVTRAISEGVSQRDKDIKEIMESIMVVAKDFPGIEIHGTKINFGERAKFETDSHQLTQVQARYLREFLPKVLQVAKSDIGNKWIKRIIIEGYADKRGTYLHNLNLSIQRSERVLCVLLANPEKGESPLSAEDRLLITKLFLVGGLSFNSVKDSLEASRRIELKLEFLEVGEKHPETNISLDSDQICPLD